MAQGVFQDYENYNGFPWYVPSYGAYMGPSCVIWVSCEQQDGISLIHCNANKSATTIQNIEKFGAIRIEKNIEKEEYRFWDFQLVDI